MLPVRSLQFPQSISTVNKKRNFTTHKVVHDLTSEEESPQQKRQRTNNTKNIPWFFLPVQLNTNDIAHNVTFGRAFPQEIFKENETRDSKPENSKTNTEENPIQKPLDQESKQKIEELLKALEDPLFNITEISNNVNDSIEFLFTGNSPQIFEFIQQKCIGEDTLKKLTSLIVKKESYSYYQILQYVASVLYAKVKALKQSASRVLLATVLQACDHQPKQVLEGIILKILRDNNLESSEDSFNKFHVEVLQRILSESLNKIAPELLNFFLTSFLDEKFPHCWNEVTVNFMGAIINQKFSISDEGFSLLVKRMQENADTLGSLLKFSSLVSGLLVKYPKQVAKHKEEFTVIIAKCKKMTKSLESRLNKL